MQEGRRTFWLLLIFLCVRQPSPTIDAILICSLFPDFTPEQTNLCVKNPQVVSAISKGINTALTECEYQFQDHRWNCTSTKDKSSFGHTRAVPGTKEAAFTSAIVAAGVAHAVTRECAKGNISSCSCDKTNEGETSPQGFKWGGCGDDIEYGIKMSKGFLDGSRGTINKKYELQNKHNSDAGRRVLKENTDIRCICQGRTGTCPMKICWRALPPFRKTANSLYNMYNGAKRVKAVFTPSRYGPRPISLITYQSNDKTPKKPRVQDLVYYIDIATQYCDKDTARGIPGVKGRICQKNSKQQSLGSCHVLCCGRGYNVQLHEESNPCRCIFQWCCKVDCQSCKVTVEQNRCK